MIAGNVSAPRPTVWSSATSNRAVSDIFMSTYDTNPMSTDQTAAFVSALAAARTIILSGIEKVRIFLDSRQKYTVGGAVTAGPNGEWAQIALPYAAHATARGVIQLVGIPRGWNNPTHYSQSSTTVIESTLAAAPAYSAAVGIASIFGSTASYCTTHVASTTAMNGIGFATQDITIRSASPVICGIDAGFTDSFEFRGLLQFDTDWSSSNGVLTVCTAPQAIPLILPFVGSQRGTLGDTLMCAGWLGGPVLGEFSRIAHVRTFCHAGASLYLDVGTQISHIGELVEWNTAYGIAAANATSAAPVSPPTTGLGSKLLISGLSLAAPLKIDDWVIQTTNNAAGVPATTNRVYDLMDANDIAAVICPAFNSTTDQLGGSTVPTILGQGGTVTGYHTRSRITAPFQGRFTGGGTIPASGTPMRNPWGRPCLVTISGGAVSAVAVNTVAQPQVSPVAVPPNASITLTYTTAPTTFSWQPL